MTSLSGVNSPQPCRLLLTVKLEIVSRDISFDIYGPTSIPKGPVRLAYLT